jgi:hypothetical protein
VAGKMVGQLRDEVAWEHLAKANEILCCVSAISSLQFTTLICNFTVRY